jgi:hypothetical protein
MIEKQNRRHGKAPRGVRVRSRGPYGHGQKYTLIMAVSPCGARWYWMLKVKGTSTALFTAFVNHVLGSLPAAGPAVRTLLWDNLSAHKSAAVWNAVTAAGHLCCARPPYRPADAPIEYMFNQLENELSARIHLLVNEAALVTQVGHIIGNLHGIDATFQHCGYP